MSTLLSLISPSCIVVPKRELRNIHFSTSAFISTTTYMACIPASDVMNINNYSDVRERTHFTSKASFRSALISSSVLSQPYYKKIVLNNDLSNEDFREPVDKFQLSYKDNSKEINLIRKATNYKSTRKQ